MVPVKHNEFLCCGSCGRCVSSANRMRQWGKKADAPAWVIWIGDCWYCKNKVGPVGWASLDRTTEGCTCAGVTINGVCNPDVIRDGCPYHDVAGVTFQNGLRVTSTNEGAT